MVAIEDLHFIRARANGRVAAAAAAGVVNNGGHVVQVWYTNHPTPDDGPVARSEVALVLPCESDAVRERMATAMRSDLTATLPCVELKSIEGLVNHRAAFAFLVPDEAEQERTVQWLHEHRAQLAERVAPVILFVRERTPAHRFAGDPIRPA